MCGALKYHWHIVRTMKMLPAIMMTIISSYELDEFFKKKLPCVSQNVLIYEHTHPYTQKLLMALSKYSS